MLSPVERALSYPYDAPHGSYLLANGRAEAYCPPSALPERRVPVIAYGSNRAPIQLARKYPDASHRIPVEAAWLEGFDAVYAARLSGYGAVPATLAPCPGCRLPVKITWLNQAQLPAMHRSEGVGVAYDFGILEVPILAEHSGLLPRALVYVAQAGAYAPDGEPLGLAEIASEQRRWQALAQRALQQMLADRYSPGIAAEAFAETTIAALSEKAARAQLMAQSALPWQEKRFRPLAPEGPL